MNINTESQDKDNQIPYQNEGEVITETGLSMENTADSKENHEEDEHDEFDTDEYTGLEKPHLIKKLKELIAIEDTDHTYGIVRKIKDAYSHFRKENEDTHQGADETDGTEIAFTDNPDDKEFYSLLKKYKEKRDHQKKEKEKKFLENLNEKKHILHELKTLPENSQNISSAFNKFHELQNKWREIGPVPAAYVMDMRENFIFYTKKFYDGLKINKELRELDMKKNLELKNELIVKAEELIKEPSIRKALETYRHLNEQWKEIGYVNKDQNDVIWEKFKAAGEQIYDRRKKHLEDVSIQQKENLHTKNLILEKMEAIIHTEHNRQKQWQDDTLKINALMEEWTKTGRVPKSDNSEVWKKFRELRHKFYNAKEKYFEGIRHEQQQNLEKKNLLCEQAEALMESTNWKAGTEELKKIQAQWKEIGPVPYKVSDKIWKRFRKSCDTFFEHKNAYFAKVDEQKTEHIKVRQEIIEKIKNFVPGENEKENYEAIKNFREEWRTAGEVPLKDKEAINKLFRSAIDSQLELLKKKSGNSDIFQQMRMEELKQSDKGKEVLLKEKIDLQHRIKKLQADVALLENNLGFFGHSKNAEKMKEEYVHKVEQGKAEIKKLTGKLKMMNF